MVVMNSTALAWLRSLTRLIYTPLGLVLVYLHSLFDLVVAVDLGILLPPCLSPPGLSATRLYNDDSELTTRVVALNRARLDE